MFVIARYGPISKKLSTFRGLDTQEVFSPVEVVNSSKSSLVLYACIYSTFSLALTKLLEYKYHSNLRLEFTEAFVMHAEDAINFKNYFEPD